MTSQLSSQHSRKSGSSSASSKALDATANAAALRAELIARIEEDSKHEELDRLEMEETKRRAESELHMQRKRRELEQGRIQKELRIEEAKAKIYNYELDREDAQSRLFVGERCNVSAQPNQPSYDLSALAGAFAAAMSLSRLPTPEPSVFDGDPLEYHDWSIAFKVLIEDKGISEADKIHYLKRYVGGSAREAISGYFLLRSTSAFERARAVLEERYGNACIVTEAFRDKLDAWPRVRDGIGLRRFSDFLNQCQAAMVDMKGLEILNDSRENRKLLQKLPDWIISRWVELPPTPRNGMVLTHHSAHSPTSLVKRQTSRVIRSLLWTHCVTSPTKERKQAPPPEHLYRMHTLERLSRVCSARKALIF